jgi:pyridoxine/pyridoxamine 5'-phosphate oxidase
MSVDRPSDPLHELGAWIDEAREADLADPAACTFATVDGEGRPSARTVTMKRVERDALVFTSALWTRKVRDLEVNPACRDRLPLARARPPGPDRRHRHRLHTRRLFTRPDGPWQVQLLSP